MTEKIGLPIYDLNILIVASGMGSKVISFAKNCDISGGTVIPAKGTVRNSILKFLELDQRNREVILILAERELGKIFLEKSSEKFNFSQANKGIAFSVSLNNIIGMRSYHEKIKTNYEEKGEKMGEYNSIMVIVEKGNAEKVVEVANNTGANGATVINARGSGINETSMLFSVAIEPEKEIILMLVKKDKVEKVCEEIRKELEIDKPGKGIIFVQEVLETYGLYK